LVLWWHMHKAQMMRFTQGSTRATSESFLAAGCLQQ
jgi:hypothetical protein